MTAPECPRERDVINAIVAGRWDHVDESLRAHSSECQVCAELAEVASLMGLDREGLHVEGSLPSAGQIWWRAAIRARLEASEQVARPLSWLFGMSVACAAGLTVAVVELLWSPVQGALMSAASWRSWLRLGELTRLIPTMADLTPMTTTVVFVLVGAAACLVLAPLALYFALSDD
jgi:hypothetical protein